MRAKTPAAAKRQGIIFILSAPSGAGKTTLYNQLREIYPEIRLSVSCTTRAKRAGEHNGRDYRFISERQFDAMRARGEFAEWAKVHDFLYGTPRKPLDKNIQAGRDILLDIDVQGAESIKVVYPCAVSIFLLPPSMGELEKRLSLRGTDDKQVIRRRLANAKGEIHRINQYDYYVVNHEVKAAVEVLKGIVEAERARTARVTEWRIEPLHGKKQPDQP
ncbi:MAG: guanylate kinase [Deltaproteobacteria bacterium]|nr:guanylate kinase [Deltaproteobacteria bacterium]